MGTSLRKMYDAELMALDTMLARMATPRAAPLKAP